MFEFALLALLGLTAGIAVMESTDKEDSPEEPEEEGGEPEPVDPIFPEDEDDEEDEEDPVDPTPVDPTPVDPTPVDPNPVDPSPVDPTPVDPNPVDPTPVDPTPVDPTPVDPNPVDPTPVDPTPVDPNPVDPTPVDPTPVDPNPVDPTPIDPTPVDPNPVDPTPVDPTPVDPPFVFGPDPVDPTPAANTLATPLKDATGRLIIANGKDYTGTSAWETYVGPEERIQVGSRWITNNLSIEDSRVFMGRGQDVFVGTANDSAFYGEDNNDTISVIGENVTISGGSGMDTLMGVGMSGSVISGGEGNDTILVEFSDKATSHGEVRGGAGNDTISVSVALDDDPDTAALHLHGGSGKDTFSVLVRDVEVEESRGVGTGIVIEDFDPAIDTLTVTLSPDAQVNYSHASILGNQAGNYSDLILHYRDSITGEPWQAKVRLNGVLWLTNADIEVRLQTA